MAQREEKLAEVFADLNAYQDFGSFAKAVRKALELTQREVAERYGCDAQNIGRLEEGKNTPGKYTVMQWANALKLDKNQTQMLREHPRFWTQPAELFYPKPKPVMPRDANLAEIFSDLSIFKGNFGAMAAAVHKACGKPEGFEYPVRNSAAPAEGSGYQNITDCSTPPSYSAVEGWAEHLGLNPHQTRILAAFPYPVINDFSNFRQLVGAHISLHNISQVALENSHSSWLSRGYISSFLRGKETPRWKNVQQMARILGIDSIDKFYAETKPLAEMEGMLPGTKAPWNSFGRLLTAYMGPRSIKIDNLARKSDVSSEIIYAIIQDSATPELPATPRGKPYRGVIEKIAVQGLKFPSLEAFCVEAAPLAENKTAEEKPWAKSARRKETKNQR